MLSAEDENCSGTSSMLFLAAAARAFMRASTRPVLPVPAVPSTSSSTRCAPFRQSLIQYSIPHSGGEKKPGPKMGPRRGGASIVMAAVRAIGLHLPYKGLVAARASNRTEFYFTCIPPARKWAAAVSTEPSAFGSPRPEPRFALCLKQSSFVRRAASALPFTFQTGHNRNGHGCQLGGGLSAQTNRPRF